MTTRYYQLPYVCVVLSILITCTLSLELIQYNIIFDDNYSHIEKVAFQKNAISLAGGVFKYQKKNMICSSTIGQLSYSEFAKDKTGNGSLLTRYHTQDPDDKDKWDARIANAKKFAVYNENQDKSENQDMISNNLFYYGLLFFNEEDFDGNISHYITSLYYTGGVKVLTDMLTDDDEFFTYMTNPYNRILFYLDLVRIWKKLAVDMKMRICLGAPSNITVRVPDEDNTDYRPIFRHPEWAVGLGQPCEDYLPNYSSKSLLTSNIESTEIYQKTIETFTLGRIIYHAEILLAHKTYESGKGESTILDEMTKREEKIYEDRGFTDELYSNASLFEAHGVYRKIIKEYRKANPLEDENANTAVNTAYEGMFNLLDTMVRENSVMNGRPNWVDVGKAFISLAQKVAPLFNVRRLLLI